MSRRARNRRQQTTRPTPLVYVRRAGRLSELTRGPLVPDSDVASIFAQFALEDLEATGSIVSGEPWPDVAADVAAMACAASSRDWRTGVDVLPEREPPVTQKTVKTVLDAANLSSPIHRDLLLAILMGSKFVTYRPSPWRCRIGRWSVTVERPIGPYFADIALESKAGRVAVEADGHEWHEKTADQAERDKRRDRYMQAQGWTVFRFTGREIHRKASRCAREVFEQMDRIDPRGRG